MTTNPYFSSNYHATDADQKLVENLIIEAIQNNGFDAEYLPRTFVNEDELYGEDMSSAFENAFVVEWYIKTVDGWGGERDFLSKFGLQIQDEITLQIARKRFDEEVTQSNSSITRPQEGDLIHLPDAVDAASRVFEITFVENETIFHQLGNLYTYEINMRVFDYGGESFNTGIDTIDDTETDSAIVETELILVDGGSGQFVTGEMVYQGSDIDNTTFEAKVSEYDIGNNILYLHHVSGIADANSSINGHESGASFDINTINNQEYSNTYEDNIYIDDNADDIVDFSPTNPFSES